MTVVRPTLKVAAGFGSTSFTASPTWTDLSPYLLDVAWGGGKEHESDRYEAVTGTIKLNNQAFAGDPAGRFSTWNTSGPYHGHLVPDTPIRVQAVFSAVTYAEAYGYADSFKPIWQGVGFSDVELRLTDGLKQLSLAALGTQTYINAVVADGPDAWWRLGDAVMTNFPADSSGNGLSATVQGAVTFGVQGPVLFDVNTAVDLTNGTDGAESGFIQCPGLSGITATWSFETWFNSAYGGAIAWLQGTNTITLTNGLPGGLKLGGALASAVSGPSCRDGKWHHVAVRVSGTGPFTATLLVDGVSQGSTTITSGNGAPSSFILLGGAHLVTSGPAFAGSMADAVVYSPAAPLADITARAQLGQYFAQVVSSGTRISQILNVAGVPGSMQSPDNGQVNVTAETSPVTADAALDYAGTVRDTEAGEFWQDPAGLMQFKDRYSAYTRSRSTTSQCTFSDDPATPGVFFTLGDPDLGLDDADLWTSITTSRPGGIDQQAGTGIRALSVSTLLETDLELESLAQWLEAHLASAIERVGGFSVDLYSLDGSSAVGGTNLATVLALGFQDRVTIVKKQHDGSMSFQQDSLIEYIAGHWTPDQLTLTFRTNATPIQGGPWFTLDVSTIDGTDELAG